MKKITCLAVLAACALCVTGCGKEENPTAEQAKSDAASIAEKAKAAGSEQVSFDRSGYRYHGRVAALAEAAREAGLKF